MENGLNELLEGLGAVGYARGWPLQTVPGAS